MRQTPFALAILFAFLCQASSVTSASDPSASNQAIDPKGLFKIPGFHQVMVSTGHKTVYIAGQVAYDHDMQLIGEGDYKAQTIRALQNVAVAAAAAGAKPEDVVSSTLHIRGLSTNAAKEILQGMAVALDGQPFPAHAFNMIGVETLADPKLLIEITAIAVLE